MADNPVKDLRDKTLSNMLWKLGERMGAQLCSFIVQLILARLLLPEAFGTIALVNVFITICNVFITNGLGTSLIQKKDADELDFSTVFFFNLVFSLSLYIVLFLCTPYIGKYYQNLELVWVIRVLGLQLLFSAVKTVQQAFVARELKFRLFFLATLIGTVFSGIMGIALAFAGAGVWALVVQYLTNSAVGIVMLFVLVHWHPKLCFSLKRLRPLFSYGWKLLAASLVDTIYNDIRTLIIGLKYSREDLAYYNRGKQFPDLVCDNTMVAIESVLFPVMSKVQDNPSEVKRMVRRFIKTCSFLMCPMLFGLAVVAKPLISLLISDKWLFCVPYIQIYCFVSALRPMQTANMQMIKALGRSDITVIIEIIKKAFGLAIIIISMPYGVFWIAASNILYSILVLAVNSFPSKKLIDYGYWEQIWDLLPALWAALGMAVVIFPISLLPIHQLFIIVLQMIVGLGCYLLIAWSFQMDSYNYLKILLYQYLQKYLAK